MELTQLKYFYMVARTQHISKSAEYLHISQSTLSVAMANLEKELGVKLFKRKGRNIELTSEGAYFAARIRPALATIEEAKGELQQRQVQEYQDLYLSIEALDFVTQIEKIFLSSRPSVRMHHSFDTTSRAKEKLMTHQCDLCISYTPFEEPGIYTELLMESPVDLLVHKNHPLAARNSVFIKELAKEAITCLPAGYGFNTMVCDIFARAGLKPNIVYEACEVSMLSFSVETNMFISFVDELTRNQAAYTVDAIHRELRIIPIEESFCKESLYLSFRKDAEKSEAAKAFIDYVRACIPIIQATGRYPTYSDREVLGLS